MDVDRYTLQHPKFPNVFPIGDCSGLPTSKTGAAIRKQRRCWCKTCSPRSVGNHFRPDDGYTSCPIVTGYGKLVLAEFDYEGTPQRRSRSTSPRNDYRCICSRPMRCAHSIGMGCYVDVVEWPSPVPENEAANSWKDHAHVFPTPNLLTFTIALSTLAVGRAQESSVKPGVNETFKNRTSPNG